MVVQPIDIRSDEVVEWTISQPFATSKVRAFFVDEQAWALGIWKRRQRGIKGMLAGHGLLSILGGIRCLAFQDSTWILKI